jgi:hypothetical protein
MHADFQELLSLRDGAPVHAGTQQHVAACAQCRLELERLKRIEDELRQLPQFSPPPLVWSAVREELGRLPLRRQNWSWLTVYAAAVCGAVIALVFLWSIHLGRGAAAIDAVAARGGEDRQDALGTLVTRSQELEAILQGLPARPTVQHVATSAAIVELQSRIQVLDWQLAAVPKDEPDRAQVNLLWSARVQLLDSLVHVRYAEAVRDGSTRANLHPTGVI